MRDREQKSDPQQEVLYGADRASPKQRLRWYQSSLKFLLLVVFAGGAALGLVGRWILKATPEEEWDRLGMVGHDPEGEVAWVVLESRDVKDRHLVHLRRFKHLHTLGLKNTAITDAGMEYLKPLTSLRSLSIVDSRVSDKGLQNIQGLRRLESLHLEAVEVTDAGLKNIQGLRRLESLHLEAVEVTDAGLKVS